MNSLIKKLAIFGIIAIVANNFSGAATADKKQEQQQLLQTLQSNTNLHARVLACKRLAIIGDEDSVPVLSKLLEDERLHHMARFALEPNPSPQVDIALRESLKKLKGKLLIGAINSIGIRRDINAVPQLIKLLQSSDDEISGAAGAALGRIGTQEAAKALRKAIQQAKDGLREDLAQSAILCAEKLYNDGKKKEAIDLYDFLRKSELPRHIRMAATRGAILSREDNGISLLIEQIKSNDDGMFALGLRVIREFPYNNATKKLVSIYERMASQKADPNKLACLLEAIGDRMDTGVVPLVVKTLEQNNPPVLQLAAIKVIGKLGEESTTDLLLTIAGRGNKELSRASYNCLITLGGKNVEKLISGAITNTDDNIKLVAIKIASERNISEAIPNLMKSLTSPNKSIRLTAISSLGTICSDTELHGLLNYLLTLSDPEEINAAEQSIGMVCSRTVNKEETANLLIQAYPKATGNIKAVLIKLMVHTPTEPALDTIKTALEDTNTIVRETAARALCDWQSPAAISDILNLALTSKNDTIKILAIRGSARLIDQSDIPHDRKAMYLKKALEACQRDDEKKIILAALGNCPDVEALKLTSELLTTPALKNEAAAAIISICQQLVKSNPQAVKNGLKNLTTQDFDQLTRKKAEEILNSIK